MKYDIQKWPEHWFKDEHEYTLNDLSQVRKKHLISTLKRVTDLCIKHVSDCELCKAKGFFCELCNDDEIIYPFNSTDISTCNGKEINTIIKIH